MGNSGQAGVGHPGWGGLFEWKIIAKKHLEKLGLEFLAPQELRLISDLRWSPRRLNDWVQGSWAAKKAAVGLLTQAKLCCKDESCLTSLVLNHDLSLCEMYEPQGLVRAGPTVHVSVGQSGEFLVALAWFASTLNCGVDVRPRQLSTFLDYRYVFRPRELAQLASLLCGQNERVVELALADWGVIGWSVKYAAFRAGGGSQGFNPHSFHVDLSSQQRPGGGEALVFPLESPWSGVPLRCAWLVSAGHVFAFVYNDVSKTLDRSSSVSWSSASYQMDAQG